MNNRNFVALSFLAVMACGNPYNGDLDDDGDRPMSASLEGDDDRPSTSKKSAPITPPTSTSPAPTSTTPPSRPAPTTTTTTPPVPTTPPPPPAPAKVSVSWNKKSSKSDYSLDIVTTTHGLIGPCVNAGTIGRSLSYTFNGTCTSPNIKVSMSDITAFRICWAEDNDWANGACAGVAYDMSSRVEIDN
jgi:hypothetical protein